MNQHFAAHPNVYEMQILQNDFTELEVPLMTYIKPQVPLF